MNFLLSVFLLLSLMTLALPRAKAQEPAKENIIVATEEWQGYTNKCCDGVYLQMLKKVFPDEIYQLDFEFVSFTNSITMHKRQLADIVLGVYSKDVDGAVYPKTHMDVDVIVAVHNKNYQVPGPRESSNPRIAWIRNYRYNEYFPQLANYIELDSREVAVTLLQSGRLDMFIDYQSEALNVLNLAEPKDSLTLTVIGYLKNFPIFQPNDRGRKLARTWDEKMLPLIENEYFRPHFESTAIKVYPFDSHVLSKLSADE